MADSAIVDSFSPAMLDTSPRLNLCMDAVYELDAIARALPEVLSGDDEFQSRLVARGMTARILRLTMCLMDGLSESKVSTEDIAKVVLLQGITQG